MARDWTNAVNQYVQMSGSGSLNVTGTALSMHAWIYMDTVDGRIISKWSATAGNRQYLFQADAGGDTLRLGSAIRSTTTQETSSGNVVNSTGVWLAAGFLKNGTGAGALSQWRNGTQDNSATSNISIQSTGTNVRIGDEGDGGGDVFDGRICEVAIWNVALTSTQFATLAKGICPLFIRRSALVGYWPIFGLASPEPDFSGNGNQGTVGAGNPAYSGNHYSVSRHILASGAG